MSTTSQYKIAIVGPLDTISGLKALGVDPFPANSGAEAIQQLQLIKQKTNNPLSSDKYAVVCIIEDLVTLMNQNEYSKVVEGALPAVVLLPGPEGSSGFAIDRLRQLAEKAVGSAII